MSSPVDDVVIRVCQTLHDNLKGDEEEKGQFCKKNIVEAATERYAILTTKRHVADTVPADGQTPVNLTESEVEELRFLDAFIKGNGGARKIGLVASKIGGIVKTPLTTKCLKGKECLYYHSLVASQIAYWIEEVKVSVFRKTESREHVLACGILQQLRIVRDRLKRSYSGFGFQALSLALSSSAEHAYCGQAPAVVLRHEESKRIFVAFRGTAKAQEWFNNAKADMQGIGVILTEHFEKNEKANLHHGFLEIVNGHFSKLKGVDTSDATSRQETFWGAMGLGLGDHLREIIDRKENEGFELIFTGHSLGGAVSIISAVVFAKMFENDGITPTVVSFASPRVGCTGFGALVSKYTNHVRIFHKWDPIPCLPSKQIEALVGGIEDVEAYTHSATHHVQLSLRPFALVPDTAEAKEDDPSYDNYSKGLARVLYTLTAPYHLITSYIDSFNHSLAEESPPWFEWPIPLPSEQG